MASKHGGNIAGGKGIEDALQESLRKQIESASETSVPLVGSSFRSGKMGELEFVIVGRHPLGLKGVAIHCDAINALMLAAGITEGISQSLLQAAQSAAKLGKPAKAD